MNTECSAERKNFTVLEGGGGGGSMGADQFGCLAGAFGGPGRPERCGGGGGRRTGASLLQIRLMPMNHEKMVFYRGCTEQPRDRCDASRGERVGSAGLGTSSERSHASRHSSALGSFFSVVASEDAARVETSAGETLVVIMRDLIEDGKIKVFRHLGRHACFVEDVVAVGVAKKRKPVVIQPSEHFLGKRICFYSDASVDPDRVAVFGKYAVRVHLGPFSRKPRMGVA